MAKKPVKLGADRVGQVTRDFGSGDPDAPGDPNSDVVPLYGSPPARRESDYDSDDPPTQELSLITVDEEVYPVLAITGGGDLAAFAVLKPGSQVLVGRDEQADIQLADVAVSRRHAVVRHLGAGLGFQVKDLGSCNGTWIDGHRVKGEQRIMVSQKIEVGRVCLRLELRTAVEVRHLQYAQARLDLAHDRDPLTRLPLRTFMDDQLPRLMDLHPPGIKPFSMVFMDLDRFHSVNENFGHQVGDEVLKTVARIIMITCRDEDNAMRYGCIPEPDARGLVERHFSEGARRRLAAGMPPVADPGISRWGRARVDIGGVLVNHPPIRGAPCFPASFPPRRPLCPAPFNDSPTSFASARRTRILSMTSSRSNSIFATC